MNALIPWYNVSLVYFMFLATWRSKLIRQYQVLEAVNFPHSLYCIVLERYSLFSWMRPVATLVCTKGYPKKGNVYDGDNKERGRKEIFYRKLFSLNMSCTFMLFLFLPRHLFSNPSNKFSSITFFKSSGSRPFQFQTWLCFVEPSRVWWRVQINQYYWHLCFLGCLLIELWVANRNSHFSWAYGGCF